jgi:hypothetical protein
MRSGEGGEGLRYVKRGADILLHSAEKERAVPYYDFIIDAIDQSSLSMENADLFLGSV